MNFAEILAQVQAIVKRPDLDSRIRGAIMASTLKLHHSNFYYRDRIETGVSFAIPDYIQNFDPRAIYPDFRKVSYIRRWNYDESDTQNFGGAAGLFKPIELGNIKDGYGYDKTEVFYLAGNLIQIRGAYDISHVLFCAYLHPVVSTEAAYSSWIADEYPWSIIYDVARAIFMQIGFQEQASNMNLASKEQLAVLTMASIAMPGE